MNNLLILSFSVKGYHLSHRVAKFFNHRCTVKEYTSCSYLKDSIDYTNIKENMEEFFKDYDAILFISSCGIAVRFIAPFVISKLEDPAIVVLDETGRFCVSLLSGHVGGANVLTKEVASLLGIEPIITTASDRNDLFAVDMFAVKNGLKNFNAKKGKLLESKLLNDKPLKVLVEDIEYSVESNGIEITDSVNEADIIVSYHDYSRTAARTNKLWLIPQKLVVGIGCRKGTSAEDLYNALDNIFNEHRLDLRGISCLASIDLKKEEQGILDLSKKWNIPFFTFSSEELQKIQGSKSSSSFVEKITGVDNVCERAALAHSNTKLILGKTKFPKITVALSLEKGAIII